MTYKENDIVRMYTEANTVDEEKTIEFQLIKIKVYACSNCGTEYLIKNYNASLTCLNCERDIQPLDKLQYQAISIPVRTDHSEKLFDKEYGDIRFAQANKRDPMAEIEKEMDEAHEAMNKPDKESQ